MADKWADYLISEVRFNDEKTHIDKVMSHTENDDNKVSTGAEMERTKVISLLGDDYTFATIIKADKGWKFGAKVRVVIVDGTKYIRTDADKIKADNLDSLPTF
jgi:hypothetical protein